MSETLTGLGNLRKTVRTTARNSRRRECWNSGNFTIFLCQYPR